MRSFYLQTIRALYEEDMRDTVVSRVHLLAGKIEDKTSSKKMINKNNDK